MKIKQYIKGHAGLTTTIVIVVVLIMIVAGRKAGSKEAVSTDANVKQVVLVDASTFRDDLSTVSVDGIVESVSQVDIKSQVSAPISAVNVEVGDSVYAGQTIAQFQNADIRAQLDQARANLDLAKGATYSGSDTASQSSLDKIRESYGKAENIVTGQIGQFLFTNNPTLTQLQQNISDQTIASKLGAQWTDVNVALGQWKASVNSLSETSTQGQINASLSVAQKTLSLIESFLATVSSAITDRIKTAQSSDLATFNGWASVTTGARNTVSALISSITSAGSSLVTSNAQVSAAEAVVKNLQAQLAKTVITSPISGKVAALPLRVGEFASMGQLVTTIVGPGGLQVRAYASSEDINRLAKGAAVTIQGTIPGVVDSVAPSVNQLNKKVEVKILIPTGERSDLVVGQNVQAKIVSKTASVTTASSFYLLPMQNIKIVPGDAYVYTLDAGSKVVKNPVVLGDVKGDYVEVKSGITDDMKIISPVYELEEGEVVKI